MEFFFGTGSEEDSEAKLKAVKREPDLSCRIEMEQISAEDENRTDTCSLIIDQQNAEQQEEDWKSVELQEESWEGTEQQQERSLGQRALETLDRRILRLLSTEDEKHMERILEEIDGPAPFSDSAKAEAPISLQNWFPASCV